MEGVEGLDRPADLLGVHGARDPHDAPLGAVGPLPEALQRGPRHAEHAGVGAEHGRAVGARREQPGDHGVVDDALRIVVVAVDLLDHDGLLALQLVGVEVAAPRHVGQDREGLAPAVCHHRGVEDGLIPGGVGVQVAPEGLDGGCRLSEPVGRAALEEHVLEQVGRTAFLGTSQAVPASNHR